MDPKTLGILGTAFSAFIAAVSYWAKTRHERRRTTRTVLYYLLEIHYLVHRLQLGLKSLSADYVGQCRAVLASSGTTMSEAEVTEAHEVLNQALRTFATAELQGLSASISEPFEKALADLSREDPVLAFRLRGRDQMLLLPKKLEAALADSDNATADAPSEQLQLGAPHLEDFLREVMVVELEGAIRATARRCGALTHLRVRLHLRHMRREESAGETRELIEKLTSQLLTKLQAARNSPSASIEVLGQAQ